MEPDELNELLLQTEKLEADLDKTDMAGINEGWIRPQVYLILDYKDETEAIITRAKENDRRLSALDLKKLKELADAIKKLEDDIAREKREEENEAHKSKMLKLKVKGLRVNLVNLIEQKSKNANA